MLAFDPYDFLANYFHTAPAVYNTLRGNPKTKEYAVIQLFMLIRVFQLVSCPTDLYLEGDSGQLARFDEAIGIMESGLEINGIRVIPLGQRDIKFKKALQLIKLKVARVPTVSL